MNIPNNRRYHVREQSAARVDTYATILEQIGISHDVYCEFQFKMGQEYALYECNDNAELASIIDNQKLYWDWFTSIWHEDDWAMIKVLNVKKEEVPMRFRWSMYQDTHSIEGITSGEHGVLLSESYRNVVEILLSDGLIPRKLAPLLCRKTPPKEALKPTMRNNDNNDDNVMACY
jgi:hypothetical protein